MREVAEHTVVLHMARALAWVAASAAFIAVCLSYPQLHEQLPLTRWKTAPKSWLIALRAPGIDLLSLALVEVLCRSLRRVPGFTRANLVTGVLLLLASFKAVTISVALLRYPHELPGLTAFMLVVTYAGIAVAAFLCRDVLRVEQLRKLTWTRLETTLAFALLAGLFALELPLLM